MKIPHFLAGIISLGLLMLVTGLEAQTLDLSAVPDVLPSAQKTELAGQREQIQARWDAFLAHRAAFMTEFAGTRTDSPRAAEALARKAELKQEADAIVEEANQYNEHVAGAKKIQRMITDMVTLSRQLEWSPEKQARLETALRALDFDGAATTRKEIRQTWVDILARRNDRELQEAAAQAGGPAWASAGQQTAHSDCAIFALANATHLPYGVVAARATKLLSEGNWRNEADRANPGQAIERAGLTGGEVIMLAEGFGSAEVVPVSAFASTLQGGRPVLVNVVPSGGRGAHEVVITKTFSHDGETWFELTESYQDPTTRLYARAHELDIIIQEKGVAYRPEAGNTPAPLH